MTQQKDSKKPDYDRVTVYVPPEMKRHIQAMADQEDRSVSKQTVVLLRQAIRKHRA